MTFSKTEFKRAQPLLGTTVAISAWCDLPEADVHAIISRAFDEGRRLEKIFNFHDSASVLSRVNRGDWSEEIPAELRQLVELAKRLTEDSKGAFTPFGPGGAIDLGGVAKGEIVDRLARRLESELPRGHGLVNAGGDMKFFGGEMAPVHLRLGEATAPVFRELMPVRPAICTSSFAAGAINPASTTTYSGASRWPKNFSVVAMAHDGALADAFTKIGMMASKEVVQVCCERYDTQVLIFNGAGEPEFGAR